MQGKKKTPKSVNWTSRAPAPTWQGAPTGKVSPATLTRLGLHQCCQSQRQARETERVARAQKKGEELGAEVLPESRTLGQGGGRERSCLIPSQKATDLRLLSLFTIGSRSLSSVTLKPNKAQPFLPDCWYGEQFTELVQEQSLQRGTRGHTGLCALAQLCLQAKPRGVALANLLKNTLWRFTWLKSGLLWFSLNLFSFLN